VLGWLNITPSRLTEALSITKKQRAHKEIAIDDVDGGL